jgi:hypothetical protein
MVELVSVTPQTINHKKLKKRYARKLPFLFLVLSVQALRLEEILKEVRCP